MRRCRRRGAAAVIAVAAATAIVPSTASPAAAEAQAVDTVTVTGVERTERGVVVHVEVLHAGANATAHLDDGGTLATAPGGRKRCTSFHVVDPATGRIGFGEGDDDGSGCQVASAAGGLASVQDGELVRVTVLVADPGGRSVDVVADDRLLATGVELDGKGPSDAGPGVVAPRPRQWNPTGRLSAPELRFTRSGAAVTGQAVDLSTDVLFAYDSDVLGPEAGAAIEVAAQQLQAQASRTVTITGHTDSQGDTAYNLVLSQRRAEAVRAALAAQLGAGWTLNASGVGESDPVADESRPSDLSGAEADAAVAEAQRVNRRVAVVPG